ncbi:2056_t:CDS:2, partial [Racocetra fulgida]
MAEFPEKKRPVSFKEYLKGQRSTPDPNALFITKSFLRLKSFVDGKVAELGKERIFMLFYYEPAENRTYIAPYLYLSGNSTRIMTHDGLMSMSMLSIHSYENNQVFTDYVGRALTVADRIVFVEKTNQIDNRCFAILHDGFESRFCTAHLNNDNQLDDLKFILAGGHSNDMTISSKLQTKNKLIDAAEREGIIDSSRAGQLRSNLPYKPDFTNQEIFELKKRHTPITKVVLHEHAPYLNHYYLERLKLAEEREKFIPNLGYTAQFDDTKPFTSVFPHHSNKDENHFDEALYIEKIAENANKRLHKSLATLLNITDRAETYWPDNFAEIFIKSQVLKKLEKMWSSAKAGQTLASLHEFAIYMIGPVVRM